MSTTVGRTLSREEFLERFDLVGPFHEGLAQVQKDGEWFQIRPDGTKYRFTS